MRIIAGEFRSRRLEAPRGFDTRPTSDRLRETLFNVLRPRVAGARFLDLYAGSGANGLEALSRGAALAVFVEQSRPALDALRKNVSALGVAARVRVEGLPVQRWLANAARASGSGDAWPAFDIIFLDPPYADAEQYSAALERLAAEAAKLIAPAGIVIAEHRRMQPGARGKGAIPTLAQQYGSLSRTRTLEQGEAALSFFMRGNPPVGD